MKEEKTWGNRQIKTKILFVYSQFMSFVSVPGTLAKNQIAIKIIIMSHVH